MTVNPNYSVEGLDTNKTVDENGDQTVDLFIASHGKTPRTGGPYMDDIERERAEEIRAKMEDREPDLDNPPATAGTRLVPKSQLVENDVDKRHISDTLEVVNEPVDSYIVPAESTEPDPTQANWDNDMSKVNALEGAKRYEALVATNQPQTESEKRGEAGVDPADSSASGGETLPSQTDPNVTTTEPVTPDFSADDHKDV